jgi:hypothetical protein
MITYTRESYMSARKKLMNPVTLFAQIEDAQYVAIRSLAMRDQKSIAEITREAITCYLTKRIGQEAALKAASGDSFDSIVESILGSKGGILEESIASKKL